MDLSIAEFLKPFHQGPTGFVGITRTNRELDDSEGENAKWKAPSNHYFPTTPEEVDFEGEYGSVFRNRDLEYYFTPAILNDRSRKGINFQYSRAIWIDFDEEVEWNAFNPKPSIVVQTSKDRVHCYWLTEWVITTSDEMTRWNTRLLQFFGNGDDSGKDATQLLKLPYGLNLKLKNVGPDGLPFKPYVVHWEPEQRYFECDFDHMPEAVVKGSTVFNENLIGLVPETPRRWDEYLADYPVLPDSIVARVKGDIGDDEDRSKELYTLILSLHGYLGDLTAVYQILHNSPRDKYSGRAGGAQQLWKDVNRVVGKNPRTMAANVYPNEALVNKIHTIINDPKGGPNTVKIPKVTELVVDDLTKTGQFTQDLFGPVPGQTYYLDSNDGLGVKAREVSDKNMSDFAGFVRERYGLGVGAHSSYLKDIQTKVWDKCRIDTPDARFFEFSHYREQSDHTGEMYIDRYDGKMYVLNGRSVSLQPNGYNDVIFRPQESSHIKPYEYVEMRESENLWDELISDGPNYDLAGMSITKEEVQFLLKVWVASFFFQEKMQTKPIMMIYGPRDSGKTTLFQCCSELFTGDHISNVLDIPEKLDDFKLQVAVNTFAFYDNVDTHRTPVQQALAKFSTGITHKVRQHYENTKMVTLKGRAFIGLTTRSITRIQDDVAQRSLIIPVTARPYGQGLRRALGDLIEAVHASRNELFSEILDFANRILKEGNARRWSDYRTELRMADFGRFLEVACDAHNADYERLEKFILTMQGSVVGDNNPIVKAVSTLVAGQTPDDKPLKFKSQELYERSCQLNRKIKTEFSRTKFSREVQQLCDSGQFELNHVNVTYVKSDRTTVFHLSKLAGNSEDEE